MPGTSVAKNRNGLELHFDEGPHEYYTLDENGTKTLYTSVTGFVERFFPKFDADAIAPRVAAKRGTTTEEILREWKENAAAACTFGTRVHECCEDTMLNRPLRNKPKDARETETFKQAVDIARKIRDRYEILGVEKVTFVDYLKLAGTVDLFARCKNKDGSYKYWILDYKTNKKIDRENPYGKFGFGQFSKFPDNNFSHYTVQLNVYEKMLRINGDIPEGVQVDRALLHITPAGVFPYRIPDIQKTITTLFDELTAGEEKRITEEAVKHDN